jgi:hypothetical protein
MRSERTDMFLTMLLVIGRHIRPVQKICFIEISKMEFTIHLQLKK